MSQFEPVAKGSAVGHGENIKVLSQAWGDRVTAVDRADAAGSTIQLAGLFSTAPYIDPVKQRAEREQAEAQAEAERLERLAPGLAKRELNVAPATIRRCGRDDCRAPARKNSEFCRWHPEG